MMKGFCYFVGKTKDLKIKEEERCKTDGAQELLKTKLPNRKYLIVLSCGIK